MHENIARSNAYRTPVSLKADGIFQMTDQELNEAVARKLHGADWMMWSAEGYATDGC